MITDREKPNWKVFDRNITKLRFLATIRHEDYEVEICVARALFELLKESKWKFWIWIPRYRQIADANNLHIKCCNIEKT